MTSHTPATDNSKVTLHCTAMELLQPVSVDMELILDPQSPGAQSTMQAARPAQGMALVALRKGGGAPASTPGTAQSEPGEPQSAGGTLSAPEDSQGGAAARQESVVQRAIRAFNESASSAHALYAPDSIAGSPGAPPAPSAALAATPCAARRELSTTTLSPRAHACMQACRQTRRPASST
jgi:hypothetical protein